MRRITTLILALLTGFGWIQAQQGPAQKGISNAERVDHWREDLGFFAATLRGTPIPGEKDLPGQKDLAIVYPHLDADLAALEAELPSLRNGAIYWRLARILASAHIGHNSIFPDDPQKPPVEIEWLDEGPVVTAASAEFKSLIGTRLLNIGGLSPAAFLDAVTPYLSFETEGWRNLLAGQAMRRRALLELLNLVQDGKVGLTVEGSRGPTVLALSFIPAQTRLISLREAFDLPVPLANSRPEERYYWRQFLADSQTLYVQYRQCADDPKLKFADFAAQTLAQIDESKPHRVIVDLRFNQGGSSSLLSPLTAGLASRRKAIRYSLSSDWSGHFLFRSVGRKRFAREGEGSSGGNHNGRTPGRLRRGSLAQTSLFPLSMQWTIKYFPSPEPVHPDITVIATAADLRAGRDSVLDAAIAAPLTNRSNGHEGK